MNENNRKLVKAIKAKCLECSGGVKADVERCGINMCPLFPFRKGLVAVAERSQKNTH